MTAVIGSDADRRNRGEREYRALIGSPPEETLAVLRLSSPDLYDAVVKGAFGETLSRAELSRPAREIATIAILAASGGAEPQLALHVSAALRAGVTPSELLALCEHVSIYAGFPRALGALAAIDKALAKLGVPRPAHIRWIDLTDHETVVAQRGECGPPVMLVHALGLDWRMWEPIMCRLAVGRRIFAYDIRSHGRAAGSPTPFSIQDAAADLINVLDAVEVDHAHFVGISYGGAVVQTAAVRHPERFQSLAILASTDHPFDAFEDRARAVERDGIEAQVVPSLTRWFTPAGLAADGWGVRYAREQIRHGDPRDWTATWRSFTKLDVQGRLAAFEQPTLVLAGELDSSTTPEIMTAIAGRIPGATYRALPATPHMQTLEQPDLVADALDTFLPAQTTPEAG